jgi:CO/xanthine dehydrogenase Mo-binding subunit
MMFDRRFVLKAGGALVIGFPMTGVAGSALAQGAANAIADNAIRGAAAGPPDAEQIDTWLAIHADNTATLYMGYAELGQGCTTALPQVAAEELDLTLDQVQSVQLDTNITPYQGGTYSSAAIARGSVGVRRAAAEARQALLNLAAERLDEPAEALRVEGGVVSAANDPDKRVTYGELVDGRRFDLAFTGTAPVKSPDRYRIVGAGAPRKDLRAKLDGTYPYMQHERLPGMLHARIVRPRGQRAYGAGAKILSVDEQSIADIPGARLLRQNDFLAVVAPREWDAVRAAAALDVSWEDAPNPLPETVDLFEAMRASATEDRVVEQRGDADAALASAARTAAFTSECPYQIHAPFAPNCAVADVRADSALIVCSSQDIYATRRGIAALLGVPEPSVRVQYREGSGTYGKSCYDDCAQAAALASQLAGAPVRLQFMRWDEHGWDYCGPPHIGDVRVGADETGRIVAYAYDGWQHNWSQVETTQQLATGAPAASWPPGASRSVNPLVCGGMYDIPAARWTDHFMPVENWLRAGWLRSPLDLSFAFTSEQAMDDLAFQFGVDPVEFRRRNIADERWRGVLDAAADAFGWTPRAAAVSLSDAETVTGRGVGLGTHLASWGGAAAEIAVNRTTGAVRILHLAGAIDAGCVVNPAIVEAQITGQLVQTVGRMLHEEVTLSPQGVTSLDWSSYRVARFADAPRITPVVVQRLDQPSSGAGEEAMAAAAAAIANAFFDATGKRMRAFPFTPERVLAALEA